MNKLQKYIDKAQSILDSVTEDKSNKNRKLMPALKKAFAKEDMTLITTQTEGDGKGHNKWNVMVCLFGVPFWQFDIVQG